MQLKKNGSKGGNDNMIRFAICDDEAVHRNIMSDYLDDLLAQKHIDYDSEIYATSAELLATEINYHILLLDVCLENGIDGIKIAKTLRQRSDDLIIVLVTFMEKRAPEGYHVNALRYIVKPIQREVFYEAVMKSITDLESSTRRLKVSYKKVDYYIPVQSILYMESYLGKTTIYTTDKDYLTTEKCESLLTKLPRNQFFMVHKSFLVNLALIDATDKISVTMINQERIKIARSKKLLFNSAFHAYMKEEIM